MYPAGGLCLPSQQHIPHYYLYLGNGSVWTTDVIGYMCVFSVTGRWCHRRAAAAPVCSHPGGKRLCEGSLWRREEASQYSCPASLEPWWEKKKIIWNSSFSLLTLSSEEAWGQCFIVLFFSGFNGTERKNIRRHSKTPQQENTTMQVWHVESSGFLKLSSNPESKP